MALTKEVEVVEATLGGLAGWAPGGGMGTPLGWLESLVVGGLEGMKLERAVRLMVGGGGGTTVGGITGGGITGAVRKGEGRGCLGCGGGSCGWVGEPGSAVA